jgi:hypothetical protein
VCKGLIILHKNAPDCVLAHEQVHESEWTPIWLIKYLLFPLFRLGAEVRAYKVQAVIEGKSLCDYYEVIRDHYFLNAKAKKVLLTLCSL